MRSLARRSSAAARVGSAGRSSIVSSSSEPFHVSSSSSPRGSGSSRPTSIADRAHCPDLLALHGQRAIGRRDAVAQGRRERRRIRAAVRLEHERPVVERDELHLVARRAVTVCRGDRVPLALPLKPRDAGSEPLTTRIEWHRYAASSSARAGRVALGLARDPPRLPHPLVAVTLDLALELVDELVDRGLVGRRRLTRDEVRPLREHDALGHVVLANRRIALAREGHLDDRPFVQPARELGEALLGVRANRIRDGAVLGLDLELHRWRSFRDRG